MGSDLVSTFRVTFDLLLRQGHPIPYEYQREYYEWLCTRANRGYASKPYPGHVTMFRTAGVSERQTANWGPLAYDGLTVLEISGGHVDMVLPPHSKLLAQQIDSALITLDAQNERMQIRRMADYGMV